MIQKTQWGPRAPAFPLSQIGERFCIKVELRVSNPPFITIGWSKRIRNRICCEISVKNFSQLNLLKGAQFTRKKGRWVTSPIPQKKETGQWKKTFSRLQAATSRDIGHCWWPRWFPAILGSQRKMIKNKDSKGSFDLLHGRTYKFYMCSVHTIHNLNMFL